jgi:mRNA interferase YafQ
MLEIVRSTPFARDTKLAQRRGKDLNKLLAALIRLENEQPLPECSRDHLLKPMWQQYRDCY